MHLDQIKTSTKVMNELMDWTALEVADGRLQELTLKALPSEIELDDVVLLRLARNLVNLRTLRLKFLENTSEQTRSALARMTKEIVEIEAPITVLELYRTGFTSDDGEKVIEALISTGTSTVKALNFSHNPVWWSNNEAFTENFVQFLTQQKQLIGVTLSGNNLSNAIQDQIRSAAS